MYQEKIAIRHNVATYEFALANLADSQTNTDVPIVGGVVATYLMPFKGHIIGYSINKSAAHSAGSLDFDLNINGSSVLTIAADTTSTYDTFETGTYQFSAGQTLGVDYTSDENLEANSVDVGVTLFVVFEDMVF